MFRDHCITRQINIWSTLYSKYDTLKVNPYNIKDVLWDVNYVDRKQTP